jgi:N-terminal domain of toast_rack, DUF2154
MGSKLSQFISMILLLSAIIVLLGCIQPEKELPGPLQNESISFPLKDAKKVKAQINMGVGNLDIQGGGEGLMEANFLYNSGLGEPKINYDINNGVGFLLVEQPSMKAVSDHDNLRNDWDFLLDSHVPMDLSVLLGVGVSDLRLGGMNLDNFAIQGGTGNITIDLIGINKDLNATINAGISDLVLNLPSRTGVKVHIEKGLGMVEAENGFKRIGESFVNEAYGISNATQNIEVKSGIGNVMLNLE